MSASFDLTALLGTDALVRGEESVPVTTLEGKVVAFYFSAHCNPCRAFTPVLAAAYTAASEAGLPFEVVFVSSDSDEDAFGEYAGTMPWPAVSFVEEERREALKAAFGCKGIPQLSVLEPTPGAKKEALQFSLVTHQGKAQVAKDKEKVIAEWCAEAAAQQAPAAAAATPAAVAAPAAAPAASSAFSVDEDF